MVVTTANDLSLIDARKELRMFEKVSGGSVLGIVENMSYFVPPDLPHQDRTYYIFGKGGGSAPRRPQLGVDFLGEIPIDPPGGGRRGRAQAHRDPRSGELHRRSLPGAGWSNRAQARRHREPHRPPSPSTNITWSDSPG